MQNLRVDAQLRINSFPGSRTYKFLLRDDGATLESVLKQNVVADQALIPYIYNINRVITGNSAGGHLEVYCKGPSVKRNFGFRFPTVFGGFGDSIGRAESWKLGMDQNNTFLVSAL